MQCFKMLEIVYFYNKVSMLLQIKCTKISQIYSIGIYNFTQYVFK